MTAYAVGDVQGCYAPLCRLLETVAFDPSRDQLWLAGDLVNRGPESLAVLRFVASLGSSTRVVLGNHDLHLLSVAEGAGRLKKGDTLQPLLEAPDASELLAFLARQPLLHHDAQLGYCMVHAGIPPHWDLPTARRMAGEAQEFFAAHGHAVCARRRRDAPVELAPSLSREERAELIVSYFTRMRVCTASGALDLSFKGAPEAAPAGHRPWFAHSDRKTRDTRILFGHWAALRGNVDAPGVHALDTGCVWGDRLTLMRLDDERRFSCSCA
jgi:bis(5'-nucleosyl)-tetraphosphatase (symmetrical)